MTHDKKIEQALKYLYNQGYGKGSNYTTMTIASLMVEYAEQQVKNLSLSAVSNSIAIQYAEFCVRCDRENTPLLCLEDYIKQYYC